MIPTRPLGSTGVEVTRLGLGGKGVLRSFGQESAARAVILAALEQGVAYLETARAYAGSEAYYGASLGPWREKIFLASKAHDRSANGAEQMLHTTLTNLRTDRLDLWQVHDLRTEEDLERVSSAPAGPSRPSTAPSATARCASSASPATTTPGSSSRPLSSTPSTPCCSPSTRPSRLGTASPRCAAGGRPPRAGDHRHEGALPRARPANPGRGRGRPLDPLCPGAPNRHRGDRLRQPGAGSGKRGRRPAAAASGDGGAGPGSAGRPLRPPADVLQALLKAGKPRFSGDGAAAAGNGQRQPYPAQAPHPRRSC